MAEDGLLEELNDNQSTPSITINKEVEQKDYLSGENHSFDGNADVKSSVEEPVKRNSNSELEWDSTQDYVEPYLSMENLSIPQTDSVFSSDGEVDNRSSSPVNDEKLSDDLESNHQDEYHDIENSNNELIIEASESVNFASETLEEEMSGCSKFNSPENNNASICNNTKEELNISDSEFDSEIKSRPTALCDLSKDASSETSEQSKNDLQNLEVNTKDSNLSEKQTLNFTDDLSTRLSPIIEGCDDAAGKETSIPSNSSVDELANEFGKTSDTQSLESEKVNDERITARTNSIEDSTDTNSDNTRQETNTLTKNSQSNCLKGETEKNEEVVESNNVSVTRYNIDNDAADSLLSELEDLLSSDSSELELPNGLRKEAIDIQDVAEFRHLQLELERYKMSCEEKNKEIKRLQDERQSNQCDVQMIKQNEELLSLKEFQIQELTEVVEQQKKDIQMGKERQQSHDVAAKRTILKLQQELGTHVDQLKKKYEDTLTEKEAMVVKYARSENEVIEHQKAKEGLERQVKDSAKTIESLTQQVKQVKSDRAKLKGMLETSESEISSLQKDVDQLKEEASSQGIKVKWAQNKLKTELDAHRETKGKLSKTEQKLSEAKEETEQIRRNCQEIIKTYQESEEMKSNSLDAELKRKKVELQAHLQEKTDLDEVHIAKAKELDSLKKAYADCMAELDSLKVKSKCLEDERIQNEKLMDKLKSIINSQKEENCKLNRQVEEIIALQELLEDERETITKLGAEVKTLHSNNMDLNSDMCTMRQKEADLLRFTEKITGKNADLHSENTTLQEKVDKQFIDLTKFSKELKEVKQTRDKLASELTSLQQFHEEETALLRTKVNEKSKAVEQLTIQLDDARDDNKTLKRKHNANVKDVTRQLQQARKRLEALENPENGHKDTLSIGSRTSSNGSLDTLPSAGSQGVVPTLDGDGHRRTESPSQPQDRPMGGPNDFPGVNKAMLVDKIIRLQKAMHKKKEKMDFMQDHMNQLVEELQRKSKIIQMYVLREESGALAPVSSDINKAKMSKQGGIMASLYKSQQSDPSMNLDLSLEINRKLQAVLEDTLLKNITLKESIETLGNEIARITSHEMDQKRGRTVKKAK
ncbi:coiled-coil domain-containing protein 186-like [Antedon mediterranea]|uniref:coiled-coil domain-containing protein 186-like n=1 Tax=Antedon mediterranea TaxID=105859 RepID=UPI003AF9B971